MTSTRSILFFATLLSLLLGFSGSSFAAGKAEYQEALPEYTYVEDARYMENLTAAKTNAEERGKPLMVVFGASWCHDSRALSVAFSHPQVAPVLKDNFEVLFIDIGYYQDRRDATMALGYPGYFATPTVLIVSEPASPSPDIDAILTFQHAASLSVDTIAKFIQDYPNRKERSAASFIPKNKHGAQLQLHAKNLTDRLQRGFEKLGVLLKQEDQTGDADDEKLNQLWQEVKAYRMALQGALHHSSEQARSLDEGAPSRLAITEQRFGPYSWEVGE
ncbi:thioredoxin family protein [Aestuariibacter sp. AA17]|uniref:Thioredoxin family protein n=1 Tax=Fluctibacter corallii TaxID=2984329 RepID=A0ABT3A619_9ALTE|nr:thioredoxin family protein [Aestuariibacter sp. AA17]MCV2883717.1 thioredoxin family protein [Aestuariibacter sp. AA17]